MAEWDKDVLADIDPEIMESMFSTDELMSILDKPDFEPGTEEDQGKLDEKKPIECPKCSHVFTP